MPPIKESDTGTGTLPTGTLPIGMLVNKLLTESEPPNRRGDDLCLPFRSEGRWIGGVVGGGVWPVGDNVNIQTVWRCNCKKCKVDVTRSEWLDNLPKGAERVGAYQPWLGPRMIRIQRCPKT
jgi:hypothetical protein